MDIVDCRNGAVSFVSISPVVMHCIHFMSGSSLFTVNTILSFGSVDRKYYTCFEMTDDFVREACHF